MTMINPDQLSGRQRRVLNLLAGGVHLIRHGALWGSFPQRIAGDVAQSMIALGLVRVDRDGKDAELVLTYLGKCTQAVMVERRDRRLAS
jgi:hypothetical protein